MILTSTLSFEWLPTPTSLGEKVVTANLIFLLKVVLLSQSLGTPSNKRHFFPPWNIFLISARQSGKLFTEPCSSPVFATQCFKICKALDWNLVLDSSQLVFSQASLVKGLSKEEREIHCWSIPWRGHCVDPSRVVLSLIHPLIHALEKCSFRGLLMHWGWGVRLGESCNEKDKIQNEMA